VKNSRLDALMMTQQAISHEINTSRIGQTYEVLVEGCEDGVMFGRSMQESPESDGVIKLESDRTLTAGEYVKVKITACDAYDLTGVVE